ncbi:MAG: TIGR04076 family protein [Candidatus Heimdallarchaeaceae archaeon]|jgi:uncharacterized repeat protein (TIGR04076 family)
MSKVKITVLKNLSPEEVFGHELKSPSGDIIKACTSFKEGEEFMVENLKKPEKFCGWAWRDIYKDLSVLAFGGDFSWTEPNTAITCCTDGMRPVVFKLERLEA